MTEQSNHISADALLKAAVEARQQEDISASHTHLREYFLLQDAIFRLARASSESSEARHAAQLGIALAPDSDLGQRVLLDVSKRFGEESSATPLQSHWPTIIAQTTGMTLAQARATRWPFRGINRPIGEVLDDGTCAPKDMAWAADAAYDEQIRRAARTVLLNHLLGVEPVQLPKPMRVIIGSRYTERQERIEVFWSGAFTAIVLGVLGVSLISALLGIIGLGIPPVWSWALIILSILVYRFGTPPIDNAINYRVGRHGEEQVVESLRITLDDRWTLIRNFVFPGRRGGDIDLLLVGPGGIWAFEVKSYSGNIRNIGDTWEVQTKQGWKTLRIHPGKQARRNASNLKQFLNEQRHPTTWVEAAVIWSYDESDPEKRGTLTVDKPQIPVWLVDKIEERASDLWQRRAPLPADTVNAIVQTLQQTIEQAKSTSAQSSQQSASTP